ncbi:MAG: GAF domain-containing protein [Candidatus Eremiobacteraeota bacterium]|nr:GAF domain-containing protein [Candidatus Eremiobacteraeota bacterium]
MMYAFVAAVVIATFTQSRGEERHRIAWTLALPLSLAFLIVHDLTAAFAPSAALWLSGDAVVIFAACVPVSVAYALIRYRVFDISFVVSRALLYATMSVLIAAMFGGVDWLLSKEIISSRWGLALGIVLALVIGFSLSAVHRRLSAALDIYVFRMRNQTRLELERLSTKMYSVQSLQSLYDLLLKDVPRALSSMNAALFEKLDDGGFLRQADVAWYTGEAWHMLADHHVVRELNRKVKTIRIEDEEWHDLEHIPRNRRPALAVPLISNRQIRGIIFYGAHLNGTDFDSSEVGMIETVAHQAGPIYDALRLRSASYS